MNVKEGDLVVLDVAALRQWMDSNNWSLSLSPNARNHFYIERVEQREDDTMIHWVNDGVYGLAPISVVVAIVSYRPLKTDRHPGMEPDGVGDRS